MSFKRHRKLLIRRWLNHRGKQTTAFVYSDLSTCEEITVKDEIRETKRYIDGVFTISDCGRQISLTLEGDKNSLEKLDGLARALAEARDFLAEGIKWVDEV